MPIKKCQSNKKPGLKFGDSGKCYTGKNKKKKAKTQGRAIYSSKSKSKGGKK